MKTGLELGLDRATGRPVRVFVEGNLISVAPPRMGKTSGLIIPNLVGADDNAWFGPAVVIDPKGDIYSAVAGRRRDLGRNVRCLDPMGIAGGVDKWNPLVGINPNDTLYMQRVAKAILPPNEGGENSYFHVRSVDVIVAAIEVAIKAGTPTPVAVSTLISQTAAFAAGLKGLSSQTAIKVQELLLMDPRTRDPILSTATQAFQWCDDERMQKLTSESTFKLSDICDSETDIFLTLPTEDIRTVDAFVRWFLMDLFAVIRRKDPVQRVVIFIDEASALGKFKDIVVASGELPGHGASIWSFWQDRSQIQSIYGEQDAQTLLRTAEFATLSDPSTVDPDELEWWSKTLGNYTLLIESKQMSGDSKKMGSTSIIPQAVRLITGEALAQLPSSEIIVFSSSKGYSKRPVLLNKSHAFVERRLLKFVSKTTKPIFTSNL